MGSGARFEWPIALTTVYLKVGVIAIDAASLSRVVYLLATRGGVLLSLETGHATRLAEAVARGRALARLVRLAYAIVRFRVTGGGPTIELDTMGEVGQVVVTVNNGFKIFDLERRTVTKCFRSDTPGAVAEAEIRALIDIGSTPFAPELLRIGLGSRSYTEELLVGTIPAHRDWASFLKSMRSGGHQLLAELASVAPARTVASRTYVRTLASHFRAHLILGDPRIPMLADLVRQLEEFLLERCGSDVTQSFSHGDFSMKHVVRSRDGHIIIDWETQDWRVVGYDLLNAYFQQVYRCHSVIDFDDSLHQALDNLRMRLALYDPVLANALHSRNWSTTIALFQLEHLAGFTRKHGLTTVNIAEVFAWAEAFRSYPPY